MKTNLFLVILSVALLSGCSSLSSLFPPVAGEGRIVQLGDNTVAENPSPSLFGGKHSVSISLDNINVVNNCPSGYFVDFYEQSRLVVSGMFPMNTVAFHPNSPYRNYPVAFRSVVYTVNSQGEKVPVSSQSRIIYINQMSGPVTVSWEVYQSWVNIQQQNMYSAY